VRVGVLDLGGNSFRVVVADVDADQGMTRQFTRGEHLHLAASVACHGRVPADRADAAMRVAEELMTLVDAWECDRVRIVATSAFRDAANGPVVLEHMARELGVSAILLSEQDEAAHTLAGAQWGFGAIEPLIVADLGGGSLNLATGQPNSPPDWLGSLPLGVSRLGALLTPEERLRSHHRVHLDAHVAASVTPLRPLVERYQERPMVVVGGTARAIGYLVSTWRNGGQPATVHGVNITMGDLTRIIDRLGRLDVEGRLRVPGVKPRRARLLPVGATILRQAMRALSISRAVVGETGLREGVLLDTAARAQVASASVA
jgi:exopolyphosphatase/guanosine-5'-triphosphate,3'-diphosphate pyrophosphatase